MKTRLDRYTPVNRIEIWQPRWKDRKVLIAKYKAGTHNVIFFTKAKNITNEFYIGGMDLSKYPVEDNGKIACYAVPLDDLEVYESETKLPDEWAAIKQSASDGDSSQVSLID